MKNKTIKNLDEKIIPINSVSKIERWHLCQQIGVVYFNSHVSFDKLLEIKDYIERSGIIS